MSSYIEDFVDVPKPTNKAVEGLTGMAKRNKEGTIEWKIEGDDGKIHMVRLPRLTRHAHARASPYRTRSWPSFWFSQTMRANYVNHRQGRWCDKLHEGSQELPIVNLVRRRRWDKTHLEKPRASKCCWCWANSTWTSSGKTFWARPKFWTRSTTNWSRIKQQTNATKSTTKIVKSFCNRDWIKWTAWRTLWDFECQMLNRKMRWNIHFSQTKQSGTPIWCTYMRQCGNPIERNLLKQCRA